MDMHQRDLFELLSAYLDGEVTAAERRQIEEWLTTDPVVQRLLARVLKLRPMWQPMPVPAAQQPVSGTVGQVFPRLNNRLKMAVVCGGTVFAAMLLGALSGGLPEHQSPVPTMATAPQPVVKPGP
jgi:anti-sigma factor RsiW